ncbi:hypothetical protein ACIA49_38645 [Kribbella sp. NPDC051587]|uniref:hypothetical protein n=1 Tax=Kribbella sp. NPDC051587 TaxID=3364119 RepID=UPI0037BB1E85
MTDVHKITTLDAVWKPGDVVFDANGAIWVRSDHVKWVWSHPSGATRDIHGQASVPDGSVEEDAAVRPLLLLVRDGQAVAGKLIEA